ncbi:50S ribosomal protein L4 [Candidatus Hepatobacter penaei]|uniref:50S ribosomal protein L4 n=1 Tax=Candidatus Hepatobacter penaei TaxID=1274402 RepID=UPI0004F358E5|nr:50S ribosomal protein L4 [Candidatus Hepatobacter penaei]TGW15890.1 50S ribosomal protein L4 [bacterium NHP-B]
MKVSVCSIESKEVGHLDLDPRVFLRPLRSDILARVVRWQLAKRQAGTHQTKGISNVSGTTRKPYKQKGTGRARQGSLRSPQFRGGGIIFGPQVRSHAHALPKRVRRLGLSVALSGKLAEQKLVVVDALTFASHKTQKIDQCLSSWQGRLLFVAAGEPDAQFVRAVRNLWRVNILPEKGLNVYDILRHDYIMVEKPAIKSLEERLV